MNGYEKLAVEIFGGQAFNGIKDAVDFEKAVDAVLETIDVEQKEAVLAVCFEGKEPDAAYAKAMRNLKHPSRSGKIKEFLNLIY